MGPDYQALQIFTSSKQKSPINMYASNFNYQHKPKTLKIAYDRVFYLTVNKREQAKITQN